MKKLFIVMLAMLIAAQSWGQCDPSIPITAPMSDLSLGGFPACWVKRNATNDATGYPKIAETSSGSADYFLSFAATSATAYASAITPAIDPSVPITTLQVKFDLRRTPLMGNPGIQVWIGTNPADWSTFTLFTTKTNSANSVWEPQVVDLSSYTPPANADANTLYYVALHLPGAQLQSALGVKNFQISLLPTCPEVLNLSVTAGNSGEAIVSWNTNTNNPEWILAYSETTADQFDVATAVKDTLTAADMPLHINNLTIGSTYSFTMRAKCPDMNGIWSDTIEFTIPYLMQLNYHQDFEDLSDVAEWEFASSSVNKWHIGNATGNSGNSLYISNDNSSNAYSAVGTMADASVKVEFGNYSNYNLSFQWKGVGSETSGYMRVYILPVNQAIYPPLWPTGGIQIGGNFSGSSIWQNFSVALDSALVANSSKKVVFIWYNGTIGTNPPPVAIDNISITGSNCATPTSLQVDSTASGMLAFSWNSTASDFTVKYGEHGFDMANEGTEVTVTTNSIVIDTLNDSHFYDIYVKADCGSTESAWAVFSSMQPNSYLMGTSDYRAITTCGGIIYDNGGYFNNYSNNCNAILTVNPSNPNEVVQLTGTYQIQSGDMLRIYDGITTSGTPLASLSSNSVATLAPVTSSFGSLTLVFTSDASTTNSGFALNVNCIACAVPANLSLIDNGNQFVTLAWEGLASNYVIEYGLHGFTPGSGTVLPVTGSDTATITGLTNLAAYDFYVKSDCGAGEYSLPISLLNVIVNAYIMSATGTATVARCGITIYDNGGPAGNYSNNSYSILVVRPEQEGQFVSLSGTFSSEANFDFLYIYDGESVNPSNILDTLTGPLGTISPIVSNSGALTLLFTSDDALPYSGFALLVTCLSCPTPSQITATANSSTSATVSWLPTEATSYKIEFGPTGFTQGTGTIGNVSGNSITIDTLSPSTNYDIYIQANCDTNGLSPWSEVVHFGTFACDNPCTYTLVAITYGSGGWDGSKLIFVQNGVPVASKTLSSGQNIENIDVPLCAGINTELVWHRDHHAFFDLNFAFTVIAPSGDTIINLSNPSAITNDATFHTFMSSCTGPCLKPTNVVATLLTANSVSVSWNDSGAPEWLVEYQLTGETTWNAVTPNPITPSVVITGLTADTYYTVRVKGICDAFISSVYSNEVEFNTTCPPPSNLTVSNVGATTATISWTAGNSESQWELNYKATSGSNWQNAGVANTSTFTISGLSTETCYDVRIRALCGQSNASGWKVVSDAFCTSVGIPALSLNNNLAIYPNPATNQLQITNYELKKGDRVEIYNMLGQTQHPAMLNLQSATIDVSHLPAGMYILKIGDKIGRFVKE